MYLSILFLAFKIPILMQLVTKATYPFEIEMCAQWHSRLQTSPKMISSLFRRTQKSLGYLEIRNLILKMKILVWCARIWLELNNLQKSTRKQCFLAVF